MTIPIRNVYYLYCYAWNLVAEGQSVDLGTEEPARIEDLLGHVLATAALRVLRHGLHREYVTERQTLRGLRGKLVLDEVLQRGLLGTGLLVCDADELTSDILLNRIVKSTAAALASVPTLDRKVRDRLYQVTNELVAVTEIKVRAEDFRRAQVHRNAAEYQLLLSVCRLVWESLLPNEAGDRVEFRDPRGDPKQMWRLFQTFVANFLRREQSQFQVTTERLLPWREAEGDERALGYLPTMRPDVVLSRPGHTLLIDAKYYQETMQEYHGVSRVQSGNLYQLMAYLNNWPLGDRVEGMLIYPVVDRSHRLAYRLGGFRVRVVTVDLSRPWIDIHGELLGLVAARPEPAPLN